jgi:DNA-binding transcriptional LysR family regulator
MLDRPSIHFLGIAEHGNLARAAQALDISQPALTRSLQGLERRLGARLFERSARGMTLTPIGDALNTRLLGVATLLADTAAEMSQLASGAIGRVRIGVGHMVADLVRDALFPRLLADRPAAKIEFYTAINVDLYERLTQGQLDFVVAGVANGVPPPLQSKVLLEETLVALVRQGHPLTTLAQPKLADFQRYGYASASGILPSHPLADRRLGEFGGKHLTQTLTTNSMTTLMEVVAKTDLLTITAWNESLRSRWADKLAAVPLPEHTVSGFVGTVRRPGSGLSPLAQYALEIIEAALASQPRLQQ